MKKSVCILSITTDDNGDALNSIYKSPKKKYIFIML